MTKPEDKKEPIHFVHILEKEHVHLLFPREEFAKFVLLILHSFEAMCEHRSEVQMWEGRRDYLIEDAKRSFCQLWYLQDLFTEIMPDWEATLRANKESS